MSILEEAAEIIDGQRQTDYGTPERNFAAIASMWTIYLRQGGRLSAHDEIYPEDIGLMMALLKIAREANTHKRDNLVDAVGYLELSAREKETP